VSDTLDLARRVLAEEGQAVLKAQEAVGAEFERAVDLIYACRGRLILTGMGKSGIVARKIAATLVSTGTPAVFLHPAEGVHGDLGIISPEDIVVAISYSGETDEVVNLLPAIKSRGAKLVCITGEAASTLGRLADVALSFGRVNEADPENLVPTTSTTVTLALGDALAVALMAKRGFKQEDFAILHPRGMLGKKLTLTVGAICADYPNPVIAETATFREALSMITKGSLGGTSIVGADGKLVGVLTDGDIRRLMERTTGSVEALQATPVREIMTKSPKRVRGDTLAYEALKVMEENVPRPIFLLIVVDADDRPVGMVHVHHLVQAGFRTSREE
jgi:arabinose-5-phosphate isomerase